MSDVPDLSLLKTIEQMGPWITGALTAVATVVGWAVRWVLAQVKEIKMRLSKIEGELPERYAQKTELSEEIRGVASEMKDHIDTIRTDVRTLHTDVKDLLKIMVNRKE